MVQGAATLSGPIVNYPSSIGPDWERFDGPLASGALWTWWLRNYYTRVEIQISVHRVLVWPELSCGGTPQLHGAPLPDGPPESQEPPARGTGPRLDHRQATHRAARLPDVLVGRLGADGYPAVAPVGIDGADQAGIRLEVPPGLIPAGGRRAGLTAHSFTRYVLGQHQQIHTGWLPVDNAQVGHAPHTQTAHRLPPSHLLYRLAVGTRLGAEPEEEDRGTTIEMRVRLRRIDDALPPPARRMGFCPRSRTVTRKGRDGRAPLLPRLWGARHGRPGELSGTVRPGRVEGIRRPAVLRVAPADGGRVLPATSRCVHEVDEIGGGPPRGDVLVDGARAVEARADGAEAMARRAAALHAADATCSAVPG